MTGVIPVSAALDLLTGEEAEAMVRAWVAAGEPVQLTVNVAGMVCVPPAGAAAVRSLVFASVVVSTAPVVIAYLLMTRRFQSGLTAGALKG